MNNFEEAIIVTSSAAAGAINKNSLGSQFEIEYSQALIFPKEMTNCTVQVDEATVWWTIPNISPELGNDKFYFEHLTVDYVVTIPKGLYSLTDLQIALEREISSLTGFVGLITLEADNATQKTSLTINQAGTQIDFTQADTFREILGFDSKLVPPAISVGSVTVLSDNVASFNTIDFFLLHCSLVDQGIRTGGLGFSQVIYQILIDVPPGSQIVSREFNPPRSDAKSLAGQTIDKIRFWLTDQNLNLVDTNGEDFSARISIKYSIPL